jgi:hypothetical protein
MGKKATKKVMVHDLSPEALMLGYLCIKDIEGLKEKVALLDRFKLPDSAIGQIIGKNDQAVRDTRRTPKKVATSNKGV